MHSRKCAELMQFVFTKPFFPQCIHHSKKFQSTILNVENESFINLIVDFSNKVIRLNDIVNSHNCR